MTGETWHHELMGHNLTAKDATRIVRNRAPTLAGYGIAAGLGILYFTDWKLVLQYMPIYNTKWPKEELEK